MGFVNPFYAAIVVLFQLHWRIISHMLVYITEKTFTSK